MKKIILLLLFPLVSHAVAISTSSAISGGAASSAYRARMSSQASERIMSNIEQNSNVIGIMPCQPQYEVIPGKQAFDMWGCIVDGKLYSINKFFEINRRNEKYKIKSIVYNDHAMEFMPFPQWNSGYLECLRDLERIIKENE